MSNKNTYSASKPAPSAEPVLPKGISPELVPLYDWWVKEGRSLLLMVLVAGVIVGGYYAVRAYLRDRNAKANAALVAEASFDDLETAVAQYGSTKVGGALRLRLAKAYYDAERYQDALDAYDKLIADKAAPAGFADVPAVGRAYALEGLKKYADAHAAYLAYADDPANTNSYLRFTARLGAARTTALLGDKAAAQKALDALKAKTTDRIELARLEREAGFVKRYSPRAERSLYDAADAAAKALEQKAKPLAPVAQPAAVKPAAAPVAKPAAAAPAKPAPAKPAATRK